MPRIEHPLVGMSAYAHESRLLIEVGVVQRGA
jgi:hypothetical protein